MIFYYGISPRIGQFLSVIMVHIMIAGCIILPAISASAQKVSYTELKWVDSILQVARIDQNIDAVTKSNLLDSAFYICERKQDICRQIDIRITQATHLDNMGQADSALIQLYWAREKYQPQCDSLLFLYLLSNLTNVFLSLNEFTRLDSVGQLALSYWNPNWKANARRYAILTNLAISKAMQGDMERATIMFHQMYSEARQAEDDIYIQKSLINLGSIKGMTEDFDSSYVFLSMALERAKASKAVEDYTGLLINLADLEKVRGNYNHGLLLLDSAFVLAERIKSTEHQANTQETRAKVFAAKRDFENAYKYMLEYLTLREQILNEEKIKSVTEMMEKYESEKKARQIQQLELDNLDATLKNERITATRNRYLFTGGIIFLVALGLWSRLHFVRKSRSAIQKEKDISEGLLLNILPASVAEELKITGTAEAKHYQTATILFSDFKDFTEVAGQLTPTELLQEINASFKEFDEIMTRYGIEKIKTIGDSYMAAGSVPDTNTATPFDVVRAGIEMQRVITDRKKIRELSNLPAFEMRVGIHSGPVVAGIVGVKKFQYDLWGDTVNIASRMESSGEVGRVNISNATYQLVKDIPGVSFTPRGLVPAKGKGEMEMYFVDVKVPEEETLEV